MPTYGGKDSKGKIIKVRPYESEGDDKLLFLTERQRGLLLAMTEYLDWKTRWETLPSPFNDDDYRDSYVSGLKNRLMIVVEICAEIINCIDTDVDVQNKLTQFIQNVIGDYNGNGGNNQLTPEELEENLTEGTNPFCDEDILYAQCRLVIDETHLAVMDVLQKVETITNVVELGKELISSIPFVAAAFKGTGADGVASLINYYQEAVTETYDAQWTETVGGTRDYFAYKLFCRCRGDCIINVNRILWVYANELSKYLAPPSLSGLIDLIETLAGINQDTTFVVELAHYVAWGLVKMARFLFGRRFDNILRYIIQLKADEPSNDWETLEGIFGACTYIVYVRADANVDFTGEFNGNDTAFEVQNGMTYALNPSLVWRGGTGIDYDARGNLGVTEPLSIVPTANVYRLVYKIGIGGTWLATDDTFEFTAGQTGILYLACNDVSGAYSDNSGYVEVDIQQI